MDDLLAGSLLLVVLAARVSNLAAAPLDQRSKGVDVATSGPSDLDLGIPLANTRLDPCALRRHECRHLPSLVDVDEDRRSSDVRPGPGQPRDLFGCPIELGLVLEQDRHQIRLAVDDAAFAEAVLDDPGVVDDLRPNLLGIELEQFSETAIDWSEARAALRRSSKSFPDDPVELVGNGHGRHGRILRSTWGGV